MQGDKGREKVKMTIFLVYASLKIEMIIGKEEGYLGGGGCTRIRS